MELINPEHSIGNKEIRYLILAVIKYLSSPIRVFALSWICIFIYTASVKVRKPMCIFWKMCWYPVKYYTNILAVHIIHKIHKILRTSVSCCWCIISCNLITPWTIKRILGNSHKLYMCISHIWYILGKVWCYITVIHITVLCTIFLLLPRTKMTFIYRHCWL